MRIGESIVLFFMRLFSLLPLKVHYALSAFLAFLIEKVFRYRREDVTVNLARSFPELDAEELKDIRHRFYRHLSDVIAESVWFGGCKGGRRLHDSHIVEIEGLEGLAAAHEAAPDIIVLMSHAGNWELYGGYAAYVYSDAPMPFNVYLRQSSRMWDSIMRRNRLAPMKDPDSFEGYLESRQVIRYALEHKGEKKIYNFITDQYPYFGGTVPVRFMHQDTVSMKGAADLARKTRAAVYYLSMPCEIRGHYKLRYLPIVDDASTVSTEYIMGEYYRLLERDLEAQPWNYLWSHRRWKHPVNNT